MPEIGLELRDEVRRVIEDAGAVYLGVRAGVVLFCDAESGARMSLYLKALTETNIKLALKDAREKVLTVAPWELTDAI